MPGASDALCRGDGMNARSLARLGQLRDEVRRGAELLEAREHDLSRVHAGSDEYAAAAQGVAAAAETLYADAKELHELAAECRL